MVDSIGELGGTLNLCLSTRVQAFFTRSRDLSPKWTRLRYSQAPLNQKLMALPAVFWSSALHGALGSTFGEQHVRQLRALAMKELRLNKAGVNGLLRLTLAQPMTADPGFFQLNRSMQDMRRLLAKCPDLLIQWRMFHAAYDGSHFSGPFSKIMQLCSQIGWEILHPPFLRDHDGVLIDLQMIDHGALDSILQDAWLQHVSTQIKHRSTMSDLLGLDQDLSFLDHHRLIPRHAALIQQLQAGAFVTNVQQAKFDLSKNPDCPHCNVPDTLEHWFVCDRYASLRGDDPLLFSMPIQAPDSALNHLLFSRSPWKSKLKHYFSNLPDLTFSFLSEPGLGVQHVFTDGSSISGSSR